MKLKEFSPDTIDQHASGLSTIRIDKEDNLLSLSKGCNEIMNLHKGMKVLFFQDEENTSNWYICLSVTGFRLNFDKRMRCKLYNKKLAELILKSACPPETKGVIFLISIVVISGRKYLK